MKFSGCGRRGDRAGARGVAIGRNVFHTGTRPYHQADLLHSPRGMTAEEALEMEGKGFEGSPLPSSVLIIILHLPDDHTSPDLQYPPSSSFCLTPFRRPRSSISPKTQDSHRLQGRILAGTSLYHGSYEEEG